LGRVKSSFGVTCLARLSRVQMSDEAVELFIGAHEHFQ
jgi:hypothetical protein